MAGAIRSIDSAGKPSGARRHLSQRAKEEIAGYLFISPWIVGFLIFTAGAMLFSLGLVFFKTDLLTGFNFYGLRNLSNMLKDPLYHKSLMVTSYYAFAVVPLSLVIGMVIALGLNQGLPVQSFWRTLYYLPSVTSGIAVAMLWMWIFHPDAGLLNQALLMVGIEGPRWLYSEQWAVPAFIIMGMWGAGGNMLLYLAGLQGIPTHLYEAARIDGAREWQIFYRVVQPLAKPPLATLAIFSATGIWDDFLWPLVVTSGENMRTVQLGLQVFQSQFTVDWGPLMAATVAVTVPVLILFILCQRYFVQSIATVGLK